MNTKDIKEAQRILDESLLRDAIRGDYLPKGSGIEDLTNSIREKMIDSYVLRDAIRDDYLPRGSGIEDLTNSIREKMSNDGNLRRYGPDGSLDTEMYY